MNPRFGYRRAGLGIILGLAMRVAAGTFYVAEDGNDGNGSTGWTDAFATIGHAVAQADGPGPHTVYVSNGLYTISSEIVMTNNILVQSWNNGALDPASTIVDGDYQTRCFRLTHADAVLAGLTVRNGTNEAAGGGVYVTGGGTVSNCLVTACSAREGGGICVTNRGLVTHSTLSENVAVSNSGTLSIRGGGLHLYRLGVVSNCVMSANTAAGKSAVSGTYQYSGGGGIGLHVAATNDECRVYGTRLANNVSAAYGGGIYFYQAVGGLTQVVISGSTVASNTSALGGGIGRSGDAKWLMGTVTGSLVEANYASGGGGGIYELTLVRNCTISGNSTPSGAGGCRSVMIRDSTVQSNYSQYFGGGLFFISISGLAASNCVIRGNSAADVNNCGGGGIMIYAPMARIENCEIRGNVGKAHGGVWTYSNATGHMYNCLVCDNVSTTYSTDCKGSGLNGNFYVSGSTIVSNRTPHPNSYGVYLGAGTVSNCIIYSNKAASAYGRDIWCAGPDSSNVVFYSCAPSNIPAGQGNLFDAPTFVNFAAGDYRLAADSPGVNAGTNEPWMDGARDLDGHPRMDPFAQRVDMGAYEFLPDGALFKLR